MKEYCVTFIQRYAYLVEAHDGDEAFDQAEELFDADMHRPIINNCWDDWEIECTSDDGEENEDN